MLGIEGGEKAERHCQAGAGQRAGKKVGRFAKLAGLRETTKVSPHWRSSGGACCVLFVSAGPQGRPSRHTHSGPESLPSLIYGPPFAPLPCPSRLHPPPNAPLARSSSPASRAASHCPAARGAWPEGHPFVTAFASKSGACRLPDIRPSPARSSLTGKAASAQETGASTPRGSKLPMRSGKPEPEAPLCSPAPLML